ncbi:23S rRNA (cytidine(2498)-2'-O)-methyltransferase RlmM [Pleionea sediminis]|uniref:23S rRNA (cytidine(2498)-2'-O)-methyltransferase RlmM n=1 Tax=Pleionea sediminis TaxID=2569479 RepID=UPI001185D7F6|nr:23S rRNA (cytidine(2498)-2'-O)-methyltransferase RlmM [Pleionea sediminis]
MHSTNTNDQRDAYLSQVEATHAKDLLVLCRCGFESEAAQELQDVAQELGIYGYVQAVSGDGFALFRCYDPESAQNLLCHIDVNKLIFSRDLMLTLEPIDGLDPDDRVTGMIEALNESPSVRQINPWFTDTNQGKSLAKLAKKIVSPVKQSLKVAGVFDDKSDWCLNLLFIESTKVWLGWSLFNNQPKWACGIAHLKMPGDAPSRSTLKLDEAILHFLDAKERNSLFGLGKTAVDLGACPGGWTYQLVRRELQVMAIDNGDMADSLMSSGQVEHIKADGFVYRPPYPVNWLVCDMVEKPSRIAGLMADWIKDGASERAIFNLKLPMKKRYAMVKECFEIIREKLEELPYSIQAKQLYHDREEITVYLSLSN